MKYKWAKREIKLWEKQKPENFICELNGEQLGKTVLKMCKVLCDEIHNYSCYAEVLRIFTRLSELKPLTPVYGDEGEWEAACIGYTYLIKGVKAYRNKRMSSLIKYVYDNGEVKYSDTDRTVICINQDGERFFPYVKGYMIADELSPVEMPYYPEESRAKIKICCEDFEKKCVVKVFYVINPNGEKEEINKYFKYGGIHCEEISEKEFQEMPDREFMPSLAVDLGRRDF